MIVEQKPPPAPAKQRRSSNKNSEDVSGKGHAVIAEEKHVPVDYALVKRAARVVAEDSFKYIIDLAHCPLPGCDSKGSSSDGQLLKNTEVESFCKSEIKVWSRDRNHTIKIIKVIGYTRESSMCVVFFMLQLVVGRSFSVKCSRSLYREPNITAPWGLPRASK